MPLLPVSTVLGILNSSENQDADEFSKCQRNIRHIYERNSKLCVYRLNLKQPMLDENKFTLTVKNKFLQFASQTYSLNMDELKNRLLGFSPTSLKLEISDLATTELLCFLPQEWMSSIQYIDIRCLETKHTNLRTIAAVKSTLIHFLLRFGKIDNIMFKSNEITTSGHDYMQYLCWWLRRQTIQTRGFRIKYESLRITRTDVENMINTLQLCPYFHLWLDWRPSGQDLRLGIYDYLNTIEDNQRRRHFVLNNSKIIPIQQNADVDIAAKIFLFAWLNCLLFTIYFGFAEEAISLLQFWSFAICICYAVMSIMLTTLG